MKPERDRYDVSGLPEAQFEPGSRGTVLKNLLGIKQKKKMDELEGSAQARAMEHLFGRFDEDRRFSATDVREKLSADGKNFRVRNGWYYAARRKEEDLGKERLRKDF